MELLHSGKVRDVYADGADLLLVASDRGLRLRHHPADPDPGQGSGASPSCPCGGSSNSLT